MATFESNDSGQEPINVNITIDEDDGIFLSLHSHEMDLDLIATSEYEIGQFFTEVEQAKQEWKRLKGDGS